MQVLICDLPSPLASYSVRQSHHHQILRHFQYQKALIYGLGVKIPRIDRRAMNTVERLLYHFHLRQLFLLFWKYERNELAFGFDGLSYFAVYSRYRFEPVIK